jgi:hypothetical protein
LFVSYLKSRRHLKASRRRPVAKAKGANAVNLPKTRVVIVGAGQAGGRAAEALRAAGHVGSIALIGEEAHLPYERPQLSKSILFDAEPIRPSSGLPAAAIKSSGETLPMASAASPSTPPATCRFYAVSSRREKTVHRTDLEIPDLELKRSLAS